MNRLSFKPHSLLMCVSATLAALAILLLSSLEAEAQRRGGRSSFGGFRSSPSYAPSRPAMPSQSYRYTPSPAAPSASSSLQRSGTTSFGGTRSMAPAASNYRRSYGIPRQSTPVSVPGASSPYIVHSYGGFADGLMMGYLMGQTSALWYMPFHPAFYYSRPVYVTNPDGTTEVYPPTFSFFRLFLGIAIIGLIVWLIIRFFRRRAAASSLDFSQSSFS
ncbi:MAG: hypothetical protein RML40_00500 [Bacteroidota bacterium]|nr:hypothetical protein [Candidatus Kapabacteria bacterium]MDW8218985.1 hypothetical protein [Bacteroidota bacterium]